MACPKSEAEKATRGSVGCLCFFALLIVQDSNDDEEAQDTKPNGKKASNAGYQRPSKSCEIVKGPWTKEVSF